MKAERLLQRKCACGGTPGPTGECAECRKKRLGLQRKEAVPRSPEPAVAPPIVHDVLRSPGRPLEPETRSFMESRFGHDFGKVRVHADAEAAESARAVGALAYTVGSHVAFDRGRYAPGSGEGKELLAHELAHVVQQGPAPASGGLPISPASDPLESQADSAAAAALRGAATDPGRVEAPGLQRSANAAAGSCGTFAVDMAPYVTGMRGSVEFRPDPSSCPACKLIRLVQIVRVFREPGMLYEWTGREAQREKVKTREKKGVEGGFFVDHKAATCSKGEGCSLYYREHASNLMRSQDGFNDGTTAEPASLWDVPDGGPNSIFELETCARCHDTGDYLGCVDWGFSSDAAGNATATSPIEHVTPSATFDAAVKKFDKFYRNR